MPGASAPAVFHLPGLFEFYELYRLFLPLFYERREWFLPDVAVGSVYGAPADCLWGGGRVGFGEDNAREVLALLRDLGIPARLTFSNLLLRPEHLTDRPCNALCALFSQGRTENGVIVGSDLLAAYLRERYPGLYLVSSTTKVIRDPARLRAELDRPEFRFVVPDILFNADAAFWDTLTPAQRAKVELLCNEACPPGCPQRRACYERVSRMALGEDGPDPRCAAPDAAGGYVFSRAMRSPAFIGPQELRTRFLPRGITNFKLEGRSLGSALVLEFLLHYLTRPEYHLQVRERIYLSASLDLF